MIKIKIQKKNIWHFANWQNWVFGQFEVFENCSFYLVGGNSRELRGFIFQKNVGLGIQNSRSWTSRDVHE